MLCTSIEEQSLGLWHFSFNPGAGKVSPPHHLAIADPLIPYPGKRFLSCQPAARWVRVLLLLLCPKRALGQGTAWGHLPHGAGTAEGIIPMQDVAQAPSSVLNPKQLCWLQLFLGASALTFSPSSFKEKKRKNLAFKHLLW